MTYKTMKDLYSHEFYDQIERGTLESARSMLRILFDLYRPESVVDFGCGRGAWLAAARMLGSRRLTGLDGDWVEREELLHPDIDFIPTDFSAAADAAPGTFDLCISVEVAEHIEETHADDFVQRLCDSSPIVMFGAAVPGQGGVNHVNEQWQSYWARKFEMAGYGCFDVFRPAVWNLESVEWWYRQNTLLYVSTRDRTLEKERLKPFEPKVIDLVHPLMLASMTESEANRIQRLMERLLPDDDSHALRELAQYFLRDHPALSRELIRRAKRIEQSVER
jgi:SAM-dependent methyltransferase